MWLFLLLWSLVITIIFSIEILIGLQWHKAIYSTITFADNNTKTFFIKKQLEYNNLFFWWFNFFFSFFSGILIGWFIEKKFRLLFKTNQLWQQKQPEFYRKTSGEKRVFLPWLVIELPILIVAIINLILLITFRSYTNFLISTIFFTVGITLGQLIEVIREYQIIIKMDRPEKPPTSIIQKIKPDFPSSYSLLLGQLYCRVLLPFFFLYMSVFIPLQLIIFPNSSDKNLFVIFAAMGSGVILRWFYDKNDNFYFNKITIFNFLFTLAKLIFLIIIIGFILFNTSNIYFIWIIAMLAGFAIPWFPEKLRS